MYDDLYSNVPFRSTGHDGTNLSLSFYPEFVSKHLVSWFCILT